MEKVLRRLWKTVSRRTVRMMFFLSDDTRRAMERWLRGQEEHRRLRNADVVVVSYPKSGRTWLRVMVSRYFQLRYGIPENTLLGFDNFHAIDPRVPKVFFTHDSYLRHYTGHLEDKRDFFPKRVILLVRKPQDVAVSQFFQWSFRTRPHKKWLQETVPHGTEISMEDFAMDPRVGLPRIVSFMNDWAEAVPRLSEVLVVRYEDMRANPEEWFARVAEFLDAPADPGQVKGAVEYASVANTRKLETERSTWRSGSRLTPRDRSNPDSYKVRRAKVGGYRDYFDDEQLARLDDYVREQIRPDFGYRDEATG